MAINLLDKVKSEYGNNLDIHTAEFFNEEQTNTRKAVQGSFAAILAGLIQRVSYEKGSKDLFNTVKSQDLRNYDIENIFTRSPQTVNGLVNRGNQFLPTIYPGKLRQATNSVAADSGVTKLTSSKMMKINAPLLLNLIGQHVEENNLDEAGLKTFLNAQQSHVEKAIPKDFVEQSELSAFGWEKKKVVVVEKPVKKKKEKVVVQEAPKVAAEKVVTSKKALSGVGAVGAGANEAAASGMGFLKWLVPLLLLLVGAWFLITKVGCGGAVDKVATTVAAPVEAVKEVATSTLGAVNDAAMGALKSISFAAGSAGDQMMTFIKGGAKGEGRFKFNNLNFASGSDVIDATSSVEVDNLAAILNAYTDVKIKIEGYTDSRGNDDSNLSLSQRRADAVRTKLLSAGIADTRIVSKGFGEINPVADNETAEGRAQNRRIEVVIVK